MSHVQIPVTLEAWLRVEDGNVTGIDLCLDTVALEESVVRGAFEYTDESLIDALDLSPERTLEVFEALPARSAWEVTRVENSDGGVYLDD